MIIKLLHWLCIVLSFFFVCLWCYTPIQQDNQEKIISIRRHMNETLAVLCMHYGGLPRGTSWFSCLDWNKAVIWAGNGKQVAPCFCSQLCSLCNALGMCKRCLVVYEIKLDSMLCFKWFLLKAPAQHGIVLLCIQVPDTSKVCCDGTGRLKKCCDASANIKLTGVCRWVAMPPS